MAKRIYLVMKDPERGGVEDNWIIMDYFGFLRFLETEEGERRKDCFARLKEADEDDSMIFMECSRERAREIKSETNHMEYLRRQEKDTGYSISSLDIPTYTGEDELSPLSEILADEERDTEKEAFEDMIRDELPAALAELSQEDRDLLTALYSDDGKMSERRYADLFGIPRWRVQEWHKAVIRKLRLYYRRKKLL